MNHFVYLWLRFRLWLKFPHATPEEREQALKEAQLIVTLERYSRTLRRMK
jgi:hypothetical protein